MIIFDKLFLTYFRPKYKEIQLGVVGDKSLVSVGMYRHDDKGFGLNVNVGKERPCLYVAATIWNTVWFIGVLDFIGE